MTQKSQPIESITHAKGGGVRGAGLDVATTLSALWEAIEPGSRVRWQLQDAKSQFSEVVERALSGDPQCVTKHGKDAVIVIAYEALLNVLRPKQNLFDFFRSSPLVGADLDLGRLSGGQRAVDL